jgi:hypothetical protein
MVEPGITAASWPFHRFLHQESVRMDADPLGDAVHAPARDAFDGNQAIPTLLIGRHRRRFAELFYNLRLHRVAWISLFAYPLSGGFKRWSLIPASLVPPMLRFETALEPWLGRLLGFRLLIVIEAMGATTPLNRWAPYSQSAWPSVSAADPRRDQQITVWWQEHAQALCLR